MEITLYQNAFCPYSERVRRVLGEMAIMHRRVEVGWHELDGLQRLTGTKEIPTLSHDGHIRVGSASIARYLNDFLEERRLFGLRCPATAVSQLSVLGPSSGIRGFVARLAA